MAQRTPIPIKDIIQAYEASDSKRLLSFDERKTPASKQAASKGATFLDTNILINGQKRPLVIKVDVEVTVLAGPIDPAYIEKAEEREKRPINLTFSRNESGDLGKVIEFLSKDRDAYIGERIEVEGRTYKFTEMMRYKHSKKAAEDKKGKMYFDSNGKEDGRFYVSLDFSLYPEKHRDHGQPKCVIFDAKKYKIKNGIISYDPLTIDGVPVGRDNAHRAIPAGTKVISAIISASSSESSFGFATRLDANILVVAARQAKGVVFEQPADEALLAKLNALKVEDEAPEGADGKEEEPINPDIKNVIDQL
jgi:hypothetical protein